METLGEDEERCYFPFSFLVISPFEGGDLFRENCVFLTFVKPLGAILHHYNPTEKTKSFLGKTHAICLVNSILAIRV